MNKIKSLFLLKRTNFYPVNKVNSLILFFSDDFTFEYLHITWTFSFAEIILENDFK